MAIDLYKNRCSVYEGEKPYIFISYSHRDIEKVVSLIRKLQSLGFRIWYDSGVPAGAEWPEEIAVHLKNSGCILSLLSANAAQSRHFKEEFNYAYHLKKPILVAYLENCDLTPGIEMRVVSQQCIKCEHCEGDEDLLEEIARAKILLPCLGEKPDDKPPTTPEPNPQFKAERIAPKSKIEQIREKAEKGDMEAQSNLGWAYEQGDGVSQDYEEALNWYRKAAAQNHLWSINQIGLLYENGKGVSADKQEAFDWYLRAAKQGYSWGQFNVGVFYDFGYAVEQDHSEAVRWYQKAAKQGVSNAMNNLGVCYEKGQGISKDENKAFELYRKATELDHSLAAQNLGKCYEFSRGTPQDWEQAVCCYRKAAKEGYAYSQKKLAQCYREGLGVPIDKDEADRWQKLYDENPNK